VFIWLSHFCRFWIWSDTEYYTPSEYGLQHNSTPHPPPPPQPLSVYMEQNLNLKKTYIYNKITKKLYDFVLLLSFIIQSSWMKIIIHVWIFSRVMHRFVIQPLQIPPLGSSTDFGDAGNRKHKTKKRTKNFMYESWLASILILHTVSATKTFKSLELS
jgi:hypothetical protein